MDLMSLMIRIGADTAAAEKGIANVQKGMEDAEKSGSTFGDKMSKIGTILKTAITTVAIEKAVKSLVSLATGAASTADHIDKMSQKIGISREAYQELDFIMSQSGTSVDSLQAGMKTLTAAMDKVREGNEDTTETFKKLGVEVTNSDGTFRSQEDVFFDTVTALQGVEDQTEKSRLATELFGKSGLELMPLLNGTAGSMEEMRKQAHKLGLVMNDDAIDAGVRLTDTIDQTKRSFSAIITQIGVDLMPVIQTVLDWVILHMPEIRAAVSGAFTVIKTVIKTVTNVIATYILPAFEEIWTFVTETLAPELIDAWNTIKNRVGTVISSIAGFWNNTLKPVFEAIYSFLEETLGPIFENTFNAIKTVVDNTLGGIKDLWENSVKPVYDGIVTFFSGVFSGDWETAWNGIQGIVEGVWNGIQIAAETAWNNAKTWATTIVANFTLAFTNAWNLVKDSVVGLWDGIKDKAEELWNGAKEWGATIIANFDTSVTNAWNLIKSTILGLWDDITNKVTEIWEAAQKWGGNIIGNFWVSINDAWTIAIDKVKGLFQQIPDAIKDIVDSALNWGKDMIQNFVDGITERWEALKDKVMAVPNKIRSWLHFSVPDEGPLSDFDTYAPDMIELFANGIVESAHLITTALVNLLNNIKTIFKLAGEGSYKEFNTALNGNKGDQLINAIKNPLEKAVNAISRINWSNIGYKIYTDVTRYTSDIYDKFRNAFDFSRIYVKTPHWWVDSWSEISGTYYPNMSVHWYKKAYQNPVMFNKPTVMPALGGYKGFGDGSGGEVVLSEAKLKQIVGDHGGDVTNNNTFNIYQRDGENMEQLARRIEDILTRQQNQRKAAFA